MDTARVFKSGNSQAVRLPKEFRFKSKEVEIFRRGNEVVLRDKPKSLSGLHDAIMMLPEDFLADGLPDPPPEEIEGL